MRYDVRLPEGLDHADNGLFREFKSKYIKNRSRKGFKPQYVAVREQSKEKHQHYHVALWLDGQKTKNIHDHIATAERLWNKTLGLPDKVNGYGLIDDCTKSRSGAKQINGVMLRRDDPAYETKKDDCFRRASYLAKVNTKGNTPKGQRAGIDRRLNGTCTTFRRIAFCAEVKNIPSHKKSPVFLQEVIVLNFVKNIYNYQC